MFATSDDADPGGADPGEGRHDRLVSMLKLAMSTADRVTKVDLRAMCEPCGDLEFGLALHAARDAARVEFRVEFVGLPRNPDVLVRADGKQVVSKMRRFTRASARKLKRVFHMGAVPDPTEMSDEDRARLQMAQDKTGMRLVQMDQINRMRKPLPTGSSTQPDFPGRPKK